MDFRATDTLTPAHKPITMPQATDDSKLNIPKPLATPFDFGASGTVDLKKHPSGIVPTLQ
jgi:hypothetical protein